VLGVLALVLAVRGFVKVAKGRLCRNLDFLFLEGPAWG